MRTFRSVSVCAILSTLFLAGVCFAAAPALITQNVDESKLVTLAGNTRPEANKQNDRGLVPDGLAMEHMFLQLKRSPAQEQELQQLIEELTYKPSPNFHHWLTAKQFGKRFGLAAQDINTITRWLESHGFTVNVVYQNGVLIDFSGTAGQVRAAFHTEIHNLDVRGVQHIANMSDPKIPAALAPAVVGVVSLHDFMPHPTYKVHPDYTIGGYNLVVPGDMGIIYNLNPLFTANISGQGQTVVVIEDTDVFSTGDWNRFRSVFGLSSYTDGSFTQINPAPPSGTNNCSDPGVNGDDIEAILDAEYSSAAAPSAAIVLASCTDTQTTFGGLIAIQNLLNESSTPPAIMSVSYGFCEAFNGEAGNTAYSTAFQQAVTEGVSVFVSSGDGSAAGCAEAAQEAVDTYGIGVSGFASTPYNVAVGGTDFGDSYAGTNSTYWSSTNSATYVSALSYVPEIPWNDSCASQLIADVVSGSTLTYGSTGFCNSSDASNDGLVNSVGGSGGPSGCATGTPATAGVVGGTCAGFAKPSWQSVFGNPSDGVRDIPDVSLFAANGVWGHYYVFCDSDTARGGATCLGTPDPGSGKWSGAGGTSFASPIMAGIQALVNQNAGGAQGNPNPVYYQLAAAEYGDSGSTACNSTLGNTVGTSCVFYDVTLGDMDSVCTGPNCYLPSGTYGVLSTSTSAYDLAYGTQTGWDFATGIGTVNAANLVNAWPVTNTTTTSVQASPTTAFTGQSVTLTATVTPSSATGTVSFYNNGSSTALGSGTLSSGTATFTTTSLPVGTNNISATYNGNLQTSSSTTDAVVTVSTPSFTVTPTNATLTVAQGGTAGPDTLTVTGSAGFVNSGQTVEAITYSCSNLPSEATCVFSPSATTTSATPTVSITTTAPSSAQLHPPLGPGNGTLYAMLLPGLFGILLTVGSRKRAARSMRLLSFIVVLGVSTLWLAACGGSSGSKGPSNPGTPQGTYTVTVNAQTAGGTAGTAGTISLTVN